MSLNLRKRVLLNAVLFICMLGGRPFQFTLATAFRASGSTAAEGPTLEGPFAIALSLCWA